MTYKTRIHFESLCVYLSMALLAWASATVADAIGLDLTSWGSLSVMVGLGVVGSFLAAASSLCRTTATMAAIMAVMAGGSLTAEPMATLLWQTDGQTRGLYIAMLLQLLAGGVAVLLLHDLIVRIRTTRILTEAFWKRRSAEFPRVVPLPTNDTARLGSEDPLSVFSTSLLIGMKGSRDSLGLLPNSKGLLHHWRTMKSEERSENLLAFVAGLVLSGVLLLVIAQSASRSQLLFALIASCAAGPMILVRYFPRVRAAVWVLVPLVLAVGAYLLGLMTSPPLSPQAIGRISPVLQLYPLDWIVAGMGGAMLGCWYAERSREHHAYDLLCETDPAEEGRIDAAILDG